MRDRLTPEGPTLSTHLTKLIIRDFRCVKSATVHLSPLHALIGPNDAGKSTIVRFVDEELRLRPWQRAGADHAGSSLPIGDDRWQVEPPRAPGTEAGPVRRDVRTLRLDPDALREPTGLIPTGAPLTLGERGLGLAAVLDAITSRDLSAFLALRDAFLRRFPTARELGTSNTATTKALQIVLQYGTVVPAEGMSEGMLCWLAFAVQPLLDPAGVLLVEHPERGLHPHRIAEVVQILRDLSERGTQVLMTTHSPLVVNALRGHEVSMVTRDDDRGTEVVRLDRTAHYADRRKVYENGELWLAHADGVAERALVPEIERSGRT